jgi:4,5-dihydroxyphthalate decarboxylase
VLQVEHGVDLQKVTWVLSGDEHVAAYQPPPNVVSIAAGATIEEQLAAGELAAAINIAADQPGIRPLIANPLEAGLAAYQARGHYPINHLVVLRNDVLEAHPHAARAVFEAFAASKEIYLRQLQNDEITSPDAADQLHKRILELGGNPLPYGIDSNRAVLEELIGHALTQGILTKPVDIEALFAPATHGLLA